MVSFAVVGLPDKAVAESRERVRAAISALGLALPPKRITTNLSPADLPKEGSHYDLPIALALLGAMGLVDAEALSQFVVVGELGLEFYWWNRNFQCFNCTDIKMLLYSSNFFCRNCSLSKIRIEKEN